MTLSIFENDQEGNIELVIFDSNDLENSAKQILKQDIPVVLGPIFSKNVKKFSNLTRGKEITVLSFSNNQDLIGRDGIFIMGFSPQQEIERITDYTISTGDDNFAIIAPFNAYGRKFSSVFTAFVKKKGGNIISNKLYLNNSKHLERSVKDILNTFIISADATEKNKQDITGEDKFYANVIFIPESGSKLAKIVRLIKKHNKEDRPIQIIGSSSWGNSSTLDDSKLVGAWFPSSAPEKYRDFEKRYYQVYKKFPPKISSIAFDAIFATSNAIKDSEERTLTKESFIYGSEENGFNGLDGLFRFLPNGIVQRNFAILEVQNGKFKVIDKAAEQFFKY
jgi:ABC-type branched-subunit amino acid transport system substrate-binding protein